MKIHAKITITVVENRELYYFVIICKCKQIPLRLFSYQMSAPTLTMDEWSIYYKVYDYKLCVCLAVTSFSFTFYDILSSLTKTIRSVLQRFDSSSC